MIQLSIPNCTQLYKTKVLDALRVTLEVCNRVVSAGRGGLWEHEADSLKEERAKQGPQWEEKAASSRQ